MQEKTAGGTPAAPIKLDVSVRVIEPVKNLMGFASVKFNDCFVVENLKIVQGSKGLFVGMPSQPDGKGGYRDMAYPVTKEFREQLNTAVLQAYEAKLEQMAEPPSSIGISPLSTSHPRSLQRTWVRPSSEFYLTFSLLMDRSPGFRSMATDFSRY